MGYPANSNSFTPADTDTKIYIEANYSSISFSDLIDRAKKKWSSASFDNIEIEAEYIHTK